VPAQPRKKQRLSNERYTRPPEVNYPKDREVKAFIDAHQPPFKIEAIRIIVLK